LCRVILFLIMLLFLIMINKFIHIIIYHNISTTYSQHIHNINMNYPYITDAEKTIEYGAIGTFEVPDDHYIFGFEWAFATTYPTFLGRIVGVFARPTKELGKEYSEDMKPYFVPATKLNATPNATVITKLEKDEYIAGVQLRQGSIVDGLLLKVLNYDTKAVRDVLIGGTGGSLGIAHGGENYILQSITFGSGAGNGWESECVLRVISAKFGDTTKLQMGSNNLILILVIVGLLLLAIIVGVLVKMKHNRNRQMSPDQIPPVRP
jgi:hypothetical protein